MSLVCSSDIHSIYSPVATVTGLFYVRELVERNSVISRTYASHVTYSTISTGDQKIRIVIYERKHCGAPRRIQLTRVFFPLRLFQRLACIRAPFPSKLTLHAEHDNTSVLVYWQYLSASVLTIPQCWSTDNTSVLVCWQYLSGSVLTIPQCWSTDNTSVLVCWQYLSGSVLPYCQAKWYQLGTNELIVICAQKEASPFLGTKIVSVVMVSGHWGRNAGWGCLRIECWGEYLDLTGTRWQGNGDSCITRSWMICTPYPILCGW